MAYDYSALPALELHWDRTPNAEDWIEARLQPEGLLYYGEDWTMPHGGPYTAGFQTYEEFLASGPLCGMPEVLAMQLHAHLLAHRTAGAWPLEVVHRSRSTLDLVGAWVHLNAQWVFGKERSALEEKRQDDPLVLYTGSLKDGEHRLTGTFAYRSPEAAGLIRMTMDYVFTLEGCAVRLELTPVLETLQILVTRETDTASPKGSD